MLDTENVMGTETHILPETHKHNDLKDLSLFDFGIQEEDLYYKFNGDYLKADKRKAVVRSDTGDFIGNHSKRYKTIPHIDLYKKHTEKLLDSNLGGGALEVIDQTWDNGAKARRTIHFLDHKTEVKNNDNICLRSDIFNSIDGSWAFQTFTGAFRSLCLNTLVFGGQKFYHERRKHTSGLNVNSALSKISNTLDIYTNQSDKFKKWSNAKVTDAQVIQLLANTVAKKESKTVATLSDLNDIEVRDDDLYKKDVYNKDLVNTNLCDYLYYRYQQEQGSLGQTLWALYNAVTHWSTHTDETFERENKKGKVIEISMGRKGSQKANVQKDREIAVRNMLDSRHFVALEGLAVA